MLNIMQACALVPVELRDDIIRDALAKLPQVTAKMSYLVEIKFGREWIGNAFRFAVLDEATEYAKSRGLGKYEFRVRESYDDADTRYQDEMLSEL